MMRLLTRRFGKLPAWAEARLSGASAAQLEGWLDAALAADSLEAVLGNPNEHH